MIQTTCNAGCKQQITINDFDQAQLADGIEKVYFICQNCGHEYVAFYTDEEIRKLQQKIRNIQKRFVNQNADHKVTAKLERKTQLQIKEKMDALRERIEGGSDNEGYR